MAVHCPTVDPPPDDAGSWPGEGKITAGTVEVEPNRFRLDLRQVVLTHLADGGLVITSWTPERGLRTARRD